MVVSEELPLDNCPHIDPDVLKKCQHELDKQHADGKWTKKDLAHEALQWAKERAASMRIEDLPSRIGGRLTQDGESTILELPYFTDTVRIQQGSVSKGDGLDLNRREQVFIYNHMAQGRSTHPGEI